MSDFYARKVELLANLDKLMVGKFEPWRAGIGAPLGDLMNARSTALNAVVTVLCDSADEDLAADVDEKVRYGQDNAVRPMPELGARIKDLDSDLVSWVGQISVEEARFFSGLLALNLGKQRDIMRQIQVDLTILIRTVQGKWATMSEANQRLEKIEADASVKMTEMMQARIVKSVDYTERAAEAVGQITDRLFKLPKLANEALVYLAIECGLPENLARRLPDVKELGKYHYGGASLSNDVNFTAIEAKEIAKVLPMLMRDPAMVVTDTFKELFPKEMRIFLELAYRFCKEVLPYYRQGYLDSVRAYQDMLPNQGSVLVSLSQTRGDVETFLRICGMDQLRTAYDTAMRLLDLWVENAQSPGAKADAQALRDAVKPMFDKRFQDTSHMFEEFVRSEQGRFIGTVKTETENALLWTPMWIDRERGVVDAGMYERLRAFRETTLRVTERFEESAARVHDQLGDLPEGIAEPAMAKFETLIAEVKAQLKDATAQAAAALDEAAATATPDAVKRDLDRSRLRALVAAG
jgi:hypothetical protein